MSRRRFYVLRLRVPELPTVLTPKPVNQAEAIRSVNWQLQGGFGTRPDYAIVEWNAERQEFFDRKGDTYPLPSQGCFTQVAWDEFLATLAKPPIELRTPGMRRWRVTVELDVPVDASRDDVKDYALDAMGTMVGCYRPPGGYGNDDPGHPVWGLDNVDVTKVGRVNQRRTA